MFRSTIKFLILLSALFVQRSLSQPKIIVRGGEKYDLGNIFEGTVTERELTVINSGNDTLFVKSVTTSCGCTVAKLSKTSVAPNDSIIVSISFTSKGNLGKFKRDIYIFSNDSTRSKVDVVYTGNIYSVLQATPRYISFGTQLLGHSDQRVVSIKNTGRSPITITSYKAPEPQLSLSVNKEIIQPNDSLQLKVVLNPLKTGKILGQIELNTNSPVKPALKISFVGKVVKR